MLEDLIVTLILVEPNIEAIDSAQLIALIAAIAPQTVSLTYILQQAQKNGSDTARPQESD